MNGIRRAVFILLVMMFLAGWGGDPSAARAESLARAHEAQPAPQQAAGRLEPRRYAELSHSTEGRVEQVLAGEGERVSAGQLVAVLDGYESRQAELARAELELVLARQALDELQHTAAARLAEVELELARLERQRDLAASHLNSLERPRPAWHLQAARANLLLADKALEKAGDRLDKARHFYADRDDFAWQFINRGPYRLYLAVLEKSLARAEQRSRDARQKVTDLQAPVDEIDLLQARADLAWLQARLERAARQREELLAGPDPDELEAAQSRLQAARASVAAAQAALRQVEIRSPLDGLVVDLGIHAGEWAAPGQRLAVVADMEDWVVLLDELGEELAVQLAPGQPVVLSLDAFPGVEMQGVVESVSGYPREEEGQVYYQTRIGVARLDMPVLWGMTARIEVPGR